MLKNNKIKIKMKAKTLFVAILMMAIFLCCSSEVQAALEGDYTYTITDGKAQITGYTGVGGVVSVPSTLGGASVTSIGDQAFWNKSGLTSLTIPHGVTSIGRSAFYGCRGLTSITMPEGVISIGNYAFCGCTSLTSVIMPQGVTSIGDWAFKDCTGITSISIPLGVTNIGSGAFSYCNSLTSITIPQGVTRIGNEVFKDCTGLTSITIPQGITSIGNYAFSWCTGLTSITIPDGVTSIGNYAFGGCTGLTSISIPEGVTSIGDSAFSYCTGITSFAIPQSVTIISNHAFQGCYGLTNINIPEGVNNIGMQAFYDCNNIASITVPQGVTSIDMLAFSGCTSLTTIMLNSATTTIYDDEFTIPGATKIIGYANSTAKDYASKYGRTFEVIGITDTLQSIAITNQANKLTYIAGDMLDLSGLVITGTYTDGSTRVEDITTADITGFNSATAVADQVLTITVGAKTVTYIVQITSCDYTYYVTDGKAYITKYLGVEKVVSIPSTLGGAPVTIISDYAFQWCMDVTSITIPQGVTRLGAGAFRFCYGLASISIPQGVTSIGSSAFYGCYRLTSITLPQEVTSIANGTFSGCEGLRSITFPQGVTSIGAQAFANCKGLTSITLPQGVTSIDDAAFMSCSGLTSIIIPQGVTSIAQNSFLQCEGLKSITIPEGVTSIGAQAFADCKSLTSITLPQSVTSIGKDAFRGIVKNDFYGWSGLTSIRFNSATTTIYDSEYTISDETKIIGYNPSTAKDFATKYNRTFEGISEESISLSIVNKDLKQTALLIFQNMNGMIKLESNYTVCEGAIVTVDGINYISQGSGVVTFPTPSSETITITISKGGYITKTISADQIGNTANIYLQKDIGTQPIINFVNIGATDVYTQIYELDITDQNPLELTADIDWRGSAQKNILLVQESVVAEFSGNKLNMVLGSTFDVTKSIFIVAESQNGDITKAKLNILASRHAMDGFKLEFGNKISGRIPESVPFFGGGEIELDLPTGLIPINIEVEDGKFIVTIGIDLAKYSYDDKNLFNGKPGRKTKIKYLLDNIKQDLSDARKSVDALKNIKKNYKDALVKPKAQYGFDASYSVFGYMEGYIDSQGKLYILDSGLMPIIEAKSEWSGQFSIGLVPMYWEAYIKAQIEAQLSLYINDAIKSFTSIGTIEGEGSIGGGGGVGLNKLLSVGGGIEGTAKPTYEMYLERENQFTLLANFGAYFVARAAIFEYKHQWESQDYLWIQHPEPLYPLNLVEAQNEQEQMGDLYQTDNYRLQDRFNANSSSQFVANVPVIRPFSTVPTNQVYSTIKTNIYSNSNPQLVNLGEQQLMVWLDDDLARTAVNRTSLLYSYFDGVTWSIPQAVNNDGTADFSPQLKVINDTAYLVWQNANAVFANDASLEQVSAQFEIACAKYDVMTNRFVDVQNIINDSTIDMMPVIGGGNGEMSIAWVKNSENNVFGLNTSNSIMTSSLADGVWSKPQQIYSIRILPKNRTDFDISDNSKNVTLNYRDIAIEQLSYGKMDETTTIIYASIANRSFDSLTDISVSLLEDSLDGNVLETKTLDNMEPLDLTTVWFEQVVADDKIFYIKVKEIENETISGNNCDFIQIKVSDAEFTATPLVQVGTNPYHGESAGLFVGLQDIRDAENNKVADVKLADYEIELVYDQNQTTVYEVIDEANLGEITLDDALNTMKVSVNDIVEQGTVTGNYEKLFFVPLALTGSSENNTDVTVKFTSLTDISLNPIQIPDVVLTFQRGKILNQPTLSLADAVAGLQYLAKLAESGTDPGQVNVINMASIISPQAGATGIRPSVKGVIALMQKLVGLRDDSFQLVAE